jgi:hypothetical protein
LEKEFPHHHAIAREVLFEITDTFEALLPNLLANKFWRQFLVRKGFRVHTENFALIDSRAQHLVLYQFSNDESDTEI